MSSAHGDKGMRYVDCHFEQDARGNGHLYGEVAQAVEIECVDCHGPAKGGRIAPARSSSALVLSVQNANHENLYIGI